MRARAQLKASLMMALESCFAQSEELARQLLVFGRRIPQDEIIAKIDAVDQDAIRRVGRRLLTGGRPDARRDRPARQAAPTSTRSRAGCSELGPPAAQVATDQLFERQDVVAVVALGQLTPQLRRQRRTALQIGRAQAVLEPGQAAGRDVGQHRARQPLDHGAARQQPVDGRIARDPRPVEALDAVDPEAVVDAEESEQVAEVGRALPLQVVEQRDLDLAALELVEEGREVVVIEAVPGERQVTVRSRRVVRPTRRGRARSARSAGVSPPCQVA